MVIHSEFLDALTPSSIRSITAKIRDKAARGRGINPALAGKLEKEA